MAATPEHAARVLGLDDSATLDDVRRARKRLAFKYHPDRCVDQERSNRHMARINAAADTLTAHLKTKPAHKTRAHRETTADQEAQRASSRQRQTHEERTYKEQPRQTGERASPGNGAGAAKNTAPKSEELDPGKLAERKLARFAAASYSNVLDRIGQPRTGPRLDVRVLNFRNAA